jgi:hypothetical protein
MLGVVKCCQAMPLEVLSSHTQAFDVLWRILAHRSPNIVVVLVQLYRRLLQALMHSQQQKMCRSSLQTFWQGQTRYDSLCDIYISFSCIFMQTTALSRVIESVYYIQVLICGAVPHALNQHSRNVLHELFVLLSRCKCCTLHWVLIEIVQLLL